MVEFLDWEPYYNQILRSFHYSREHDERTASLLTQVLPYPRFSISDLEERIQGRTIIVFGAHERVEKELEIIREQGIEGVFIAADGACSAMRTADIQPDIIVSDLDGKEEDILYWNEKGIPIVVHAHGDNSLLVQRLAPKLLHSLATTQSEPFDDVHNFGGFTDGDRCVFLADHFGAYRIVLSGFDFDQVGKYSFATHEATKLRKLKWSKKLISLFEVEYFSSALF